MPKKVFKKKLINFTKPAWDKVKELEKETSKNPMDALNDYLSGEKQYIPMVEKLISGEMAAYGISRQKAIESLLAAHVKLTDGAQQ